MNTPLRVLCAELHVFVSVFTRVCRRVCVLPAAVYSCMAAAGFLLLLPLKAAAHCYSGQSTQINKQS